MGIPVWVIEHSQKHNKNLPGNFAKNILSGRNYYDFKLSNIVHCTKLSSGSMHSGAGFGGRVLFSPVLYFTGAYYVCTVRYVPVKEPVLHSLGAPILGKRARVW